MPNIFRPTTEAELVDIVAAASGQDRLAIVGGSSKAPIGQAAEAQALSTAGIAGVVDYDPAELILTVRPGTPLAEVEALVATERQMLAFDPYDHGPIFGVTVGAATIGGVVAAGVAGSRRVSAGGARDHLLGLRAVSGRGEAFVAGAKVVKNVTGYDVPKLAAGSWGRLFALSELTLKVLPRPEMITTIVVSGLAPAQAIRAMAMAMGSQAEVAAAAHRPASSDGASAMTAFRIEGFGPSVEARCILLTGLLRGNNAVARLSDCASLAFWDDFRTLKPLPGNVPLWRVNVPPAAACGVIDALQPFRPSWMADWAGGLLWIATDAAPIKMRDAARQGGGHATLVRRTALLPIDTPAFHPQPPALSALEERVRRAFDPLSLFETGRF